ncbi:hypothetical protein PMI41_01833 [Phyllobacterium sp. YR531]|nr:hypothetical protein PMI41_01833 [Phyllobacterium sp. YR531]
MIQPWFCQLDFKKNICWRRRLGSGYKNRCDSKWEHPQGTARDNPGWQLRIDLRSTDLVDEYHRFEPKKVEYEHELNWYIIYIENDFFTAAGGPETLLEIIREFLDFAEPDTND